MQPEQNSQLAFFDAFSQPVVLVRGGAVVYCNTAAKQAGIRSGEPETAYILPGPAIWLNERPAQADAYPYGEGTLYIAGQNWAGTPLASDALLHIAKAIRAPLSDLFTVSPPMFLALEEMEDPSISRAMASLNRSFYQLLHLTHDLTDASAAACDRLTAARGKLELCGFLQEIFEKTRPLCAVCGAALSCVLPEKKVSLWADAGKLRRAVYHLLASAMKYARAGGKIDLRLSVAGNFAIIEVQDDGETAGRMQAALETLAKPSSLERLHGGENLGLSIAGAIARAHGGTLVISADQNGGTTAALSLSLAEPTQQELALCSTQEKFDDTGGYRPELVALSQLLPPDVFDTININ